MRTRLNHLLKALKDHIPRLWVVIVYHGILEWFEEIFLELKTW